MYEKYKADGFELIAFPANQFGCQAPYSSQVEREYAFSKFGMTFPVYDKIGVKNRINPQCEGPQELHPLYKFLKAKKEFSSEIGTPASPPRRPRQHRTHVPRSRPERLTTDGTRASALASCAEWNYVKFLVREPRGAGTLARRLHTHRGSMAPLVASAFRQPRSRHRRHPRRGRSPAPRATAARRWTATARWCGDTRPATRWTRASRGTSARCSRTSRCRRRAARTWAPRERGPRGGRRRAARGASADDGHRVSGQRTAGTRPPPGGPTTSDARGRGGRWCWG